MDVRLSKIAIVAGDADLAERVCRHFRAPRTYVVVIEAPLVRLEEFGVLENDCIALTNAIKGHHPRVIVLLSCSAQVSTALRPHLPQVEVITLEDCSEATLRDLPGFRKHPVDVNTTYFLTPNCRHIVAVEANRPMSLLIARNLAAAMDADVCVLPEVSDDEIESRAEQLRTWANESGTTRDDAKRDLLDFISTQLGPLRTAKLRSISFITGGIPYGLYPFLYPTTHMLSYPLLGVNTLNGMVKSLNWARRCPAVVFIDPHTVVQNEVASLKDSFGRAGYLLRNACGENATAGEARDLTELMPCDFIFYSTHCGEVDGQRITESFLDDKGNSHVIRYDLVRHVSLSATPGMISVLSFSRFLSLDGIPWTDKEGKRKMGAGDIFKAFINMNQRRGGDPDQYAIIDSVKSPPIKSSDALKMHDFNYCPMPQVVGGYMHPVVFNNACSSWRELASRFGCHGAAVYIGTSLDVLDSVARTVASKFGQEVSTGRPVGYALFRAQKDFVKQLDYSPYLMHGYLFTTLQPLPASAPPPRSIVAKRIIEALANCERDWGGEKSLERQLESAKAFLQKELAGLQRMRPAKES